MSNQRTSQKRREQRRAKRKQRQNRAKAPKRPRRSADRDRKRPRPIRAWATAPLAMRISGRFTVIVESVLSGIRSRSNVTQREYAFLFGSLLAGGFLGGFTIADSARTRAHEIAAQLNADPTVYGPHLEPAALARVSVLVWGARLFSFFSSVECAGSYPHDHVKSLLPLSGKSPEGIVSAFLGEFTPAQIAAARSACELARRWEGSVEERPDAPALVIFELHTDSPVTLRYAMDRRPAEFAASDGRYWWTRDCESTSIIELEAELSPCAALRLYPSGAVRIVAAGNEDAAALAMRLQALAGSPVTIANAGWGVSSALGNMDEEALDGSLIRLPTSIRDLDEPGADVSGESLASLHPGDR